MTLRTLKTTLAYQVNCSENLQECRYRNTRSPINPSRNMSKEIALDLRKYTDEIRLSSLPADTASLAIEASETGIPRVNPTYLIKRDDNHVIPPGRDKRDVLEMFGGDEAGKKIREMLLSDNQNNAYVWISSSGPWPETRIQVGAKKTTVSERFEYFKRYDISTTLSPDRCLALGQLLISMSNDNIEFPQNTDELRKLIIKLTVPQGVDPFEHLSEIIDLPESKSWESILTGQADKNKAKALKAAVVATEPVRQNPHVIYSNPIMFGAYVENQMARLGFEMNPKKFGCGISNNDVQSGYYSTISEYYSYQYQNSTIDAGDGLGPADVPCPVCRYVNKRPFGGYVHSCQNSECPNPKAIVCGV